MFKNVFPGLVIAFALVTLTFTPANAQAPISKDRAVYIATQTGDSWSVIEKQIRAQLGKDAAKEYIDGALERERAGEDTGVPLIEHAEDPESTTGTPATRSALSNVRVWGHSIRDRHAWRMKSTIEYVKCPFLGLGQCKVVDRRATKITIDPGNEGVKITFSQLRSPNGGVISTPSYLVRVYRTGKNIKSNDWKVGVGKKIVKLSHPKIRGSRFAFLVDGWYRAGDVERGLKAGRTVSGHCTDAKHPDCWFVK